MTVLTVAVLAGIVVLTPVAIRLSVPQPILLLIYGLILGAVPGIPALPQVNAEHILPVVLPPLLFAATQRTTVGHFREAAAPVLLLAVGLTLASAAVAAGLAALTGLSWTAAIVLGAVVCPPDPVAATAVARRLRLPERMVTILEGEGMFNDATALVLYKVAVAAAVTGAFSAGDAVLELVVAVVGGVLIGLVLGWVTKIALAALHYAGPETTVTLAMPFVAYLGAEEVGGSGVLAVLVLGLYLRTYGHASLTSQGWLLGRSVWDYVDYLITGIVFVLVGVELVRVIGDLTIDGPMLTQAAVVLVGLVVIRPVWLFPAAAALRATSNRRNMPVPLGTAETALVSWAGMRGVVTVATALALPTTADDGALLGWRDAVLFIALLSVLVTLLLQGLTLQPLARRLGVGSSTDESAEMAELRMRAMRAGLEALKHPDEDDPDAADQAAKDPVLKAAVLQYEGRLRAHEALMRAARGQLGKELQEHPAAEVDAEEVLDESSREMVERLGKALQRGNNAERDLVLQARATGEVSPAAADEVLGDIEARAVRIMT